MIFEGYIGNEGFRIQVAQAVNILEQSRAFQVLLEIAAERGQLQPSEHPTETAALTASYINGYHQALKDLHGLGKTNASKKDIQDLKGYQTVKALHENKEITDAEFESYKQRHNIK